MTDRSHILGAATNGHRLGAWALVASSVMVVVLLSGITPVDLGIDSARAGSSWPAPHPAVLGSTAGGAVGSPAPPTWRAGGATAVPLTPVARSGRGTFFVPSEIAPVPVANRSCDSYYSYGSLGPCTPTNTTNDPSLNVTSRGLLAVAYTAFANITPCGPLPGAQTEIGFSRSTDQGATWSTPIYLGNTQCDPAHERNFTDAWEPSLTSLANGTLVLAYVQFNLTGNGSTVPFLGFTNGSYNVLAARLVVQLSYDNGTRWTSPLAVNTSYDPGLVRAWAPVRPWVTAHGDTVYLAWVNESEGMDLAFSFRSPFANGSSQVHLVVSTNGGQSFGAHHDLPVLPANNSTDAWAMNPTELVLPNGTLVLAYDTNLSLCFPCTVNGSSIYDSWTADLVAGLSSNNGSSFSFSTLAHGVYLSLTPVGELVGTEPDLAYDPASGELYAVAALQTPVVVCPYPGYCPTYLVDEVAIANVSVVGAHVGGAWTDRIVGAISNIGTNAATLGRYAPAVAVGPGGVVDVTAVVINASMCSPAHRYYWNACGPVDEVFTSSADHGATWTPAVPVGPSWSYLPYEYDGETTSLIAAGPSLYSAWSQQQCNGLNQPPNGSYIVCAYPPYPALYGQVNNGSSTVTVAALFRGAGVNVSFDERGLPAGTPWSVELDGNLRAGAAPAVLSVSGVPTGVLNVSWQANSTPTQYGVRYIPNGTPASPSNFTTNTTVHERFRPQYLLNLATVPLIPGYDPNVGAYCGNNIEWDDPSCSEVNYNITPDVGPTWAYAGARVPLAASLDGYWCNQTANYGPCTIYYVANLTFQSWTGIGNGSVNSTALATNLTMNGPVNETANFLYDSYCWVVAPGYGPFCYPSNSTVEFVEHGLPTGTAWGVSTWGPEANASRPTAAFSNTTILAVASAATVGVTNYSAWVVPGGSAGTYWVPSTYPASPVELPAEPIVDVNYTLVHAPPARSTVIVQGTGLPNAATGWSFGVDGRLWGMDGSEGALALASGPHQFNASPVYLPNGTGYYPAAIDVWSFVMNGSWRNATALPMNATTDADTYVTVTYAPLERVIAAASVGGAVSRALSWVPLGHGVVLNATTVPGYAFVGWTGVGSGSVTSDLASITVDPIGAVEELATFAALGPPRYTLTAVARGLPSDEAFTITLGGVSYTGEGSLRVPGLLAGNYSFADGTVEANASALTEYSPTSMSSTFATTPSGALIVGSDGMVNLTYTPEFALVVSSTGPGTTTPSGLTWEANGTTATIAARPAPHYALLGWVGTGPGSYSGSALRSTVTLGAGPVSEAAQFVYRPNPSPATYRLTVEETGLPSGTEWGFLVGGSGVFGLAPGLVAAGLNGSYTLSAATVPGGSGVRYIPSAAAEPVTVTANVTVRVAYLPQYLLTVVVGSGGTVVGAGGWYNASAQVSLTAAPLNSSFAFVGWNASTGASTAVPTIELTMSGPVNETATFRAVYPTPPARGSPAAGMPLALALLFVGAGAGAGGAVLALRGRRPPPGPADNAAPGTGETAEGLPDGDPDRGPSES